MQEKPPYVRTIFMSPYSEDSQKKEIVEPKEATTNTINQQTHSCGR